MPRVARVVVPGMIYHVTTRGNNRERVFCDQEDFEKYLEICGRYKEKYGFRLYHWVLMNNHVHLLLETEEEGPLAKIMQGISLAYTIWFNKREGKVGHLWQDRFKSVVIERDSYLLECGRYIERNPLRAGLVKDPGEYRWSSYRAYAYGEMDLLTERHDIFESMGTESKKREMAYRDYVCSNREREEQELKEKMTRGIVGTEGYCTRIEKKTVDVKRRGRGRPKK